MQATRSQSQTCALTCKWDKNGKTLMAESLHHQQEPITAMQVQSSPSLQLQSVATKQPLALLQGLTCRGVPHILHRSRCRPRSAATKECRHDSG
jgi:hypothetical protein